MDLAFLLLQSLLLFVVTVVIWSVQSWFILHFARRYIFPSLYKNTLTEWLIAGVAITIHEGSHLITALFTGSTVDLRQSYISPRAGQIAAARTDTIGGWLSSVIAATAPAFIPPLLFSVLFIALVQPPLQLDIVLSLPSSPEQILTAFSDGFAVLLAPTLSVLLNSLFSISSPIVAIVLIYFIIVCSIAAGPSEGDWKSTLDLFISPVPAIAMLLTFFLLNILFSQFGIGFLVPFTFLLSFLLCVVVIGNILAWILASFIEIVWRKIR
jgi:hypothetical protein